MVPPFEIFRLGQTGPVWCATAKDFESAKAQAMNQAASKPAAYMVVSLQTRNRVVITPDRSSSAVGRLDN
jgi:hypothetical protein